MSYPEEPLTVNLLPEAWDALDKAAEITGEKKTDCVNRALIFYAAMHQAQAKNGVLFLRETPDNEQLTRLRVL